MPVTTSTFKTPFTQYREHSGEPVTILRELDDSERDPEVGRMFHVRFSNGTEGDAFAEELSPSPAD